MNEDRIKKNRFLVNKLIQIFSIIHIEPYFLHKIVGEKMLSSKISQIEDKASKLWKLSFNEERINFRCLQLLHVKTQNPQKNTQNTRNMKRFLNKFSSNVFTQKK